MGVMTLDLAVIKDPEIMSGSLCFRGTRVPVSTLFDYIEGGHDLRYFLEGFPTVSREQALAVLEAAVPSIEDALRAA